MCSCLKQAPPTGDLAHNPGMCPDWEWNQRPFGSQDDAQSTEPHQPGLFSTFQMGRKEANTEIGARSRDLLSK